MKGKVWWTTLVMAGALAVTAGFLAASSDRAGRAGETRGKLPGEPPALRGVITQVEPAAAEGFQGPTGTPPPGRGVPAGEAAGSSAATGDDPDEPVTASPGSTASSGAGGSAGAAAATGPWRILVEELGDAGNRGNPDNDPGGTRSPLPIWLTVDDRTQVGAGVGRHFFPLPPEGVLQPGQRVQAWVRGGIRESYPAQADAAVVLVDPFLEGVVEERAPGGQGDGAGGARLLVRGRALPPHAAGTAGAVWITVDERTVLARENGGRAVLNDLKAGTPVTAWAAFPMLMSDPPQAYAPLVVVKDGN